jgi:membrane protease YdiL (CAAX protease family)
MSALGVFCPAIAASILVYRENETASVTAPLKKAFDHRRIAAKVWYVPMIFLMPAVTVLSYGSMRMLRFPLPSPQFPIMAALAIFVVGFIGALGEELGWSGYVIDPTQERLSAVTVS